MAIMGMTKLIMPNKINNGNPITTTTNKAEIKK
jgi:hypothetical protein